MSDRIEFTKKTKRKVAERAGQMCSFIKCNELTSGPGARSDEVSRTGTAAHIYSASEGGPRGQGGLSDEELKSVDNAIWLCRNHGDMVDNNRGEEYPPSLLMSYKNIQETRMKHEQRDMHVPTGWVHKINFTKGPLFENKSSFEFSKLNLIYGDNSSGKTALMDWMEIALTGNHLSRWDVISPNNKSQNVLSVTLTIFIPQEVKVGARIINDKGKVAVLNGREVPENPYCVNIVRPNNININSDKYRDDIVLIKSLLNLKSDSIDVILRELESYEPSRVEGVEVEGGHDGRDIVLEMDHLHHTSRFKTLSVSEKKNVLCELSSAYARYLGRYSPTVLILDPFMDIINEEWFDFYSDHFISRDNNFQTFLSCPSRDFDISKIEWNGWEVIKTSGNV